MPLKPFSIKNESGVVLVVSLIMLSLLTLIGTTALQSTGLEEKMSGNMRDQNMAFQAAESALQEGEANANLLPFNCTKGRFPVKDRNCNNVKDATEIWTSSTIWSQNSVTFSGELTHLVANPNYIIEDMGVVPAVNCSSALIAGVCPEHYFRVTARASGGTTSSLVMLQSVIQI